MSKAVKKDFGAAAVNAENAALAKRKRRPVVGMRVSEEEKAALERAAGREKLAVNAYLRRKVFGDTAVAVHRPVRTRSKAPVKDWEALGRVLAALGRSGIPDTLERLIAAQKRGAAVGADDLITPRTASGAVVDYALVQASTDIATMRRDLMAALGLQAQNQSESRP